MFIIPVVDNTRLLNFLYLLFAGTTSDVDYVSFNGENRLSLTVGRCHFISILDGSTDVVIHKQICFRGYFPLET